MSTHTNPDHEDQGGESDSRNPLLRAGLAIRRSFLLFIAVVGIVLVAIGASPLVTGLFAGMFGIWGATALGCALFGFVCVTVLRILDG